MGGSFSNVRIGCLELQTVERVVNMSCNPRQASNTNTYVGGLSDVNNFNSSGGSSSSRNDCCRSSASSDSGIPTSPWVDMTAVFSRREQAVDLECWPRIFGWPCV